MEKQHPWVVQAKTSVFAIQDTTNLILQTIFLSVLCVQRTAIVKEATLQWNPALEIHTLIALDQQVILIVCATQDIMALLVIILLVLHVPLDITALEDYLTVLQTFALATPVHLRSVLQLQIALVSQVMNLLQIKVWELGVHYAPLAHFALVDKRHFADLTLKLCL
jgi:hypothetical protein